MPWFLGGHDGRREVLPGGGQERRRDPEQRAGEKGGRGGGREVRDLNGVARRSVEVARAGQVRFQRRDVSTEFQSKKLRTRGF